MRTNIARWVTATLCAVALIAWAGQSAVAQYPQPDGPHHDGHAHDGHPHDGHMTDRLAEVLERLDRIAERLDRPQAGPQPSGPYQPTPSASTATGPQAIVRPVPPQPHPAPPRPQFQPPAATRHMMPMQPGQLPPPLVEMLEGRDRQLAEMREMFEARASEMAEAHERQMAEMREAIESRVQEMAAARERSQAMLNEMGKQVAETRAQVAKTLEGMGAFKDRIEEARHAMGMFKERAEEGGRRFAEMADRLDLLEREIDRLHAELRERDDDRDDDDEEDDD